MNIAQLEARVKQLADLEAAATKRCNDIIDLCAAENRASTDDEAATIVAARNEVRNLRNERSAHEATIADLKAAEASEGRASVAGADSDQERRDEAASAAAGNVKVTREPLVYEKWNTERSYLADLVAVETGRGRVNADEARARLTKHADEMRVELPRIEARARRVDSIGEGRDEAPVGYERRDLNRSDGTGGYAVPPAWLMGEYIELVRANRVTANLCRSMPLPPGTDTINIPKVSTGTAVAVQTADNAAVNETDLADTYVTASVKTIAGQQDLAMQLLDQSPINFDQIVFADLIADHAMKLDQQVLSGSNASGQVRGIRSITSVDTTAYTDGSPTVPELYPKLADSYNVISTTRYLPPEVILMHPRRWAWMLASLDSSNRPLVLPSMAQNPFAVQGANAAEGFVGTTAFGPVYVDANIPTNIGAGTNEDVIILTRPSELYLWEGPIRSRVLTEVLSGNLTVRLQVYSYFTFLPDRRPESTSIISGTGLVSPAF